eukprot:gene5018-10042_t
MSDQEEDIPESSDWLKDEIEEENEERMIVNPTYVRERIDNSLTILADFKNRRNTSQSRSDIIAGLSRDLSEYFGYLQELSELFLELFSPAECVEFMEASDKPRPLVIRTNTLKTTRKDLMDALSKRGVSVEAIDWSKVAIKVTESTVPIGATPEYLAGHYMLQSAASMNPVMALDPQPGERILDMSSAPGGKTSYVSQLMKNTGTVIANDLKQQRQKATVANMHRMGVKNGIVCCYDGRKIPQIMRGFDRVLLDAPCSGLGVIARDQTVKLQRTIKDIQRNSHLQKELLCAAVDAVDPKSPSGGIIVYSTCSVSTEENEQVVQYILQKRHVRLIDTGLEVGKPGLTRYNDRRFHPSLSLTRRFYPHVHNMDGFYVAKLQKYANGPKNDVNINDNDNDNDNGGRGGGGDDDEDEDNMDVDDEQNDEDDGEEEEEEEKKTVMKKTIQSQTKTNNNNIKTIPKDNKSNTSNTPPPVAIKVISTNKKDNKKTTNNNTTTTTSDTTVSETKVLTKKRKDIINEVKDDDDEEEVVFQPKVKKTTADAVRKKQEQIIEKKEDKVEKVVIAKAKDDVAATAADKIQNKLKETKSKSMPTKTEVPIEKLVEKSSKTAVEKSKSIQKMKTISASASAPIVTTAAAVVDHKVPEVTATAKAVPRSIQALRAAMKKRRAES